MSQQIAHLPEPTHTDPLDFDGHAIDCQIDHRVTLADTHLHRAGEYGTYRDSDSSGDVAVSHWLGLARDSSPPCVIDSAYLNDVARSRADILIPRDRARACSVIAARRVGFATASAMSDHLRPARRACLRAVVALAHGASCRHWPAKMAGNCNDAGKRHSVEELPPKEQRPGIDEVFLQ